MRPQQLRGYGQFAGATDVRAAVESVVLAQQLVTVDERARGRYELRRNNASLSIESAQFVNGMGQPKTARDLGGNFLRPIFAGVGPTQFADGLAKPWVVEPELVLGPQLLNAFLGIGGHLDNLEDRQVRLYPYRKQELRADPAMNRVEERDQLYGSRRNGKRMRVSQFQLCVPGTV